MCHIIKTDTQISLFCIFSLYNEVWNDFWVNSLNSKKIITLQKETVRLMAVVNLEICEKACLRD
jgi:hypothetical protein